MPHTQASASGKKDKVSPPEGGADEPHMTDPVPANQQGLTPWERDQIRRRAHALWREAGFPQGRDREFWAQAELQILKGGPGA